MLHLLASLLVATFLPHAQSAKQPAILPDDARLLTVHSPSAFRMKSVPSISASGALLLDVASGEVIFSKAADTERPMASLTKIMTALIILEHHSMDEIVTVPKIAENIRGSGIGLKTGTHFTTEDLLKALLLPSANDVAYTLALHHSDSIPDFVQAMNDRAKALGLTHTHFANPAGLDNPKQYSTARDLAWLTIAGLQHPLFRQIVALPTSSIKNAEGVTYHLNNTNEILHSQPNVFGVKTGTTGAAGECLITLFTQGRKSYALVLLGSDSRYTDALTVMRTLDTRVASATR